jgi:hypothetical protein
METAMISATAQETIVFTVDRKAKAVFTTARGIVSRADIIDHIEAKMRAGVLAYAELFDGRETVLDLSMEDLPIIAETMRTAMADLKPGKVAVVADSGFLYSLARSYAELTREDNPQFEVFTEMEEAREWFLS